MPRPKKSDHRHGEGILPIPFPESSTPATDLSHVPVEDLMAELHHRGFGFVAVKADEGRPGPVEVPALEAIYTELLAQELERRGWECFPPEA